MGKQTTLDFKIKCKDAREEKLTKTEEKWKKKKF